MSGRATICQMPLQASCWRTTDNVLISVEVIPAAEAEQIAVAVAAGLRARARCARSYGAPFSFVQLAVLKRGSETFKAPWTRTAQRQRPAGAQRLHPRRARRCLQRVLDPEILYVAEHKRAHARRRAATFWIPMPL